jgi:UDP-N-acetylglucosamine 4-epimerase
MTAYADLIKALPGRRETWLVTGAAAFSPLAGQASVVHRDFRAGDIRHSLADISRAERLLGYAPEYDFAQGLARCATWYAEHFGG